MVRDQEDSQLNQESDPYDESAYEEIHDFFEKNMGRVFYGRQIEVIHEDKFFHWVTNRVLHQLVDEKEVLTEKLILKWGGNITLYWHKSLRYYKREAKKLLTIVEKYSDDKIGSTIGRHCELLVVEDFQNFNS